MTEDQEKLLDLLKAIEDSDKQVSVVGSVNADYVVTTPRFPLPGETLAGGDMNIFAGGKSANQAASAARLGAKVNFFGAVGDDSNAAFLLDRLNEAGVNTDDVRHVPGRSGTTFIMVDPNGENMIVYLRGANSFVDRQYVSEVVSKIVHSAVVGLCLEISVDVAASIASVCQPAEVPVLLNDSPFNAQLSPDLIAGTEILLVNEHEMSQLLGIPEPANSAHWDAFDWNTVAERMQEFGYQKAIITFGAAGSLVMDHDKITEIPPVKVNVVDTTGCGDAFMGTTLACIAAEIPLEDAARLASVVAAYAATGQGAQSSYGTAAQIARFIRNDFKK